MNNHVWFPGSFKEHLRKVLESFPAAKQMHDFSFALVDPERLVVVKEGEFIMVLDTIEEDVHLVMSNHGPVYVTEDVMTGCSERIK